MYVRLKHPPVPVLKAGNRTHTTSVSGRSRENETDLGVRQCLYSPSPVAEEGSTRMVARAVRRNSRTARSRVLSSIR